MLCSVKVLAGELAYSNGEPFIKRSFFDPPGIEPECLSAGHPAGDRQKPKIRPNVGSVLPHGSRMKVPIRRVDQRTEVDINCPAEAIPGDEAIIAVAYNVCERIADVL